MGFGAAGLVLRLVLSQAAGEPYRFYPFFPVLILATASGGAVSGVTCLAIASLTAVLLPPPSGVGPVWAFVGFWTTGGLAIATAQGLADSVRLLKISQRRQNEAQARLETVVRELAHRNRNALFVIMAIVSQSARAASSAAEAERVINGRLRALLRAQEALLATDDAVADLGSVIGLVLEPFDLARFRIEGASKFPLDGDLATGLGLLFHELATNAVKYGALSAPGGAVILNWRLADESAHVTWREIGGPRVEPPSRHGFGAKLAEVALVPQGGKVERRFEADGLVCEIQIPPTDRKAADALGSELVRRAEET
ncbi:sensor histidine kinase [Phenylobacterium montanum]|uniref:histidine kinase n=1 Tax=Phenylobacterium montanum TaxID=2823693 RepID=A0A975IWR6_9CAUL|nr:sensor histidine kinase [Caulobacter sp. S6]QUD90168.1 sensor histidine kinase [Caulobacter sp. S6]